MSLRPGTSIGPYEIVTPLGAGGMGEVYKARDPRLDRTVAIKILPEHVGANAESKQRFEREAKALAALSHPHICSIFDVGEAIPGQSPDHPIAQSPDSPVSYLVMEHLEGETLAQRLERGALPLDQALRYAIEMADALDKAHRQGIVHRDLKPGNVMLTKSGAKLLDFGLAKLRPAGPAKGISLSAAPTMNSPLTGEGSLVGTFQYMAPEQLEGQEADARTDMFAFGAVVYEMVTGRKAFEGKSQASLIGAILRDSPRPISDLQSLSPPALDRTVGRCLAKNPEDRWQDARDLRHELEWTAHGAVPATEQLTSGPPQQAQGRRRAVPLGLALPVGVLLLAAAGVAWIWRPAGRAEASRVVRLAVALPPGEQIRGGATSWPAVAVSPDGGTLAYVSGERLYLRAMDRLAPKPTLGTDGARSPFFSPDGQWIGFFAQGQLKKVSVTGGTASPVCPAPFAAGGAWGPDDNIYFAPFNASGLSKCPAAGGTPEPVTSLDRSKGEVSHRWPQVVPGGNAVVFTVWKGPGWDEMSLELQRLDTGERKVLVRGSSTGRVVSSGYLVHTRAGQLTAVPFDLDRFSVGDSPVPLGVQVREGEGSHYAISDSGTLAYVGGDSQFEGRLVWVSRDGRVEPIPAPLRSYQAVAISPDGRRAALTVQDSRWDFWIHDLVRHTQTRLATGDGSSQWPQWMPDGSRLVYRGTRTGFRNLYWNAVDGTGQEERLTTSEKLQTPASVSPDGQLLAYTEIDPLTGSDVGMLSLGGAHESRAFLNTLAAEDGLRFSPDGRWVAFQSDESGRNEIYVQPFPGPGGKVPISTEGGQLPVWSRDGRELFYVNGLKMMVVGVTTQPTFTAGAPRPLFEGRYEPTRYDVSPDGTRFLRIQPTDSEQAATQIIVVLNWTEELRRLVP
jgi:serine/threonine-protein kinase